MEALSPFHLLVILAVFVLFFGGKKIPEVAKGLGEGIRSFKEGMHGTGQGSQTTQVSPPAAPASTPAIEEKK